jgi:hypothetical protein
LLDYIAVVDAERAYADSAKRDVCLISKKFFRWLHDE